MTDNPPHPRDARSLARYRAARVELLGGLRPGNRDPLVEWSERFVAELLDGTLAPSPVQKDWDVEVGSEHVQVRYLANAPGHWVNEHRVTSLPGADRYAMSSSRRSPPALCSCSPTTSPRSAPRSASGTRTRIACSSFTQANYRAVIGEPDRFRGLDVRVFTLDQEA